MKNYDYKYMYEKFYILNLLKNYIHHNNETNLADLDWDIIALYSKIQNLDGILYVQTKKNEFLNGFAASIYSYKQKKYEQKKVIDCFRINGIECFIVKGTCIAELYTEPYLRTMGDSDIIIHENDLGKADEIMLSLGYICKGRPHNHEWTYLGNNQEFEIHSALLYKDYRYDNEMLKFGNDIWNHVNKGVLDWDFHFIYLILHLRKHIMGEGSGIRQFLDLAVVIENVNLDWNNIEFIAKKINIYEFLGTVLFFLKSWFEIDIPFEEINISDEFFEFATNEIFEDGLFGHRDKKNSKNTLLYNVNKNGNKIVYKNLIKAFFIPYKDIIEFKEYSFVKGRPYFLPIAWIYRALKKRKKIAFFWKSNVVTRDEINERMNYLKKWNV